VEAIRSFAGAVADGTVRLDQSGSLDRLIASLMAIPGVGPRTADYIALRIEEPRTRTRHATLGLRRALARLAGPSSVDVAGLDSRWRPFRALAACTCGWFLARAGTRASSRQGWRDIGHGDVAVG
jgi:AraC family transcriptional regulator of adaptative response / DNA-3-methyladenine glycosylase II